MQRFINRRSLPHSARVLLAIRTRNPTGGGSTTTYTDVDDAEAISCRVSPFDTSTTETLTADQLATLSRVVVSFDAGTDLPPTARLFIRGATNGHAWELLLEIIGKRSPRSTSSLARYVCAPVNKARA